MRILIGALMLSFSAMLASAGFMEQMKAHQMFGYAQAAVEACPKLKINPSGVLQIMKRLDGEDQAAVAGAKMMTDHQKEESMSLFAMLGDGACEAALDYESKIGIDIFLRK